VTDGDVSVTLLPRTSDGWDVFDGLLQRSHIETPTPLGGEREGRCL